MPRTGNIIDFTYLLLEASGNERSTLESQAAHTARDSQMSTQRTRSIVRVLSGPRDDLLAGRTPRLPDLDCFRGGPNQADERAHARAGW